MRKKNRLPDEFSWPVFLPFCVWKYRNHYATKLAKKDNHAERCRINTKMITLSHEN